MTHSISLSLSIEMTPYLFRIFFLSLLRLSFFSLLCHDNVGDVEALTFSSDIAALKALKAAVKPGSIQPWSCLASWNFSTDPCLLPRRTFFVCGILCNTESTRITQLTLDPAGYSGTLSPLVSQLTELTVIDLSDNYFSGSIPSSISSLSNLQILTLRSNAFSGPVSPAITNLKNLDSLDLSHNSLSGNLPSSLNSLSSLRRLDLSYNRVGGALPKLPPNLQEVALKRNFLSGALSESSFSGLTQLEVVELSENSLTGTLESWFFLLPSLQQVDLSNNSLTSVKILKPASNFSSDLVAVDLGFNNIEGYAPANFAAYPLLSSLSLRYNRLRGSIPLEYSQKKSLRRLYLDGNFLTGKPPPGFFAEKSSVSGSLGDNCLDGCPPSSALCTPSQKPNAICKEANGGGKPRV